MPDDANPLETFLRDWAEASGGAWELVEPAVYDLLCADDQRGLVRVTFDPEAVPEHPGSQLVGLGTPLVDGLLADAMRAGRCGRVWRDGLNLAPHDLAGRVTRALTLAPGVTVRPGRARTLEYPQAVFWFEAAFHSDQKEQALITVGLDLHSGREVRQLDELLDPANLTDRPVEARVEAPRRSLPEAYREARRRTAKATAVMAAARHRELRTRLDRQVDRMRRYYADLRREADESARRLAARGEPDDGRTAERKASLDREETVRIAELEAKSRLRVRLTLRNVLEVRLPKISLRCTATRVDKTLREPVSGEFVAVWNPLRDGLEALECAQCRRPGYSVAVSRTGAVVCAECLGPAPGAKPAR
jgi:hypothetical protein